MAAVVDHDIPTGAGWTALDTTGAQPLVFSNISDEVMTLRFNGAGDTRLVAAGAVLQGIPAGCTLEARHGAGTTKTVQILRGGVAPG